MLNLKKHYINIKSESKEQLLQKLVQTITKLYIFFIIVIFPLLVDKTGFFRILEFKYSVFVCSAIVYITLVSAVVLYFLIIKNINYFKLKKVPKCIKYAVVFLIINIIATICSPYIKEYNLFLGVGRKEGLITISLYIITFIYIVTFGRFEKKFNLYFSISSILLNLIAILQYVGFNPFNIYQEGIGTHNVSFMTTIGNVDFISAVYCILLPVSFISFVFLEEKKCYKVIHLLSILMGSFIFQIINVSSGKVAFITILLLVVPYIILNNKRLARALIIFNMVLIGYCVNNLIGLEYHYDLGSLVFNFKFNYIVILFFVIISIVFILVKIIYNLEYNYLNNKKIVKRIYIGYFIIFCLFIVFIYNFTFSSGILYELHEILNGNLDDNFGTYRIFLWKRALSLIKESPLIGTGPDTFVIRFMPKFYRDVQALGELTINDTAANSYLTMLVNIGAVGLCSYIVLVYYLISKGIKKKSNNKYIKVFLIAFVCFLIQDFFNLWVVVVIPIYFVLMSIYCLCIEYLEE